MQILALDLGKFKTTACMYNSDDNSHRFLTCKTRPLVLHDLAERLGPDRVVYEVGTPAGWVHDVFAQIGLDQQVANPSHEGWRWRGVKTKTDRLDALKLARLSASGDLPQVYIPSPAVRQRRALIRYRQQVVRRRTRIKNTIRSRLHAQGLHMPSGREGWTRKTLEALEALTADWHDVDGESLWRATLREELAALAQVEAQLRRIEVKLDELAKADRNTQLLQTIPGVGPRTAETLSAVIDDPHRFDNGKQVAAYLGLTPRQFQSGTMDRSGRISKQGDGVLRQLLVEVGWLTLRYNPTLAAFYHQVCRGSRTRRKVAVVAVARKLAVIAWAMLRDGRRWSPPAEPAA